jgi:hypothetical protein
MLCQSGGFKSPGEFGSFLLTRDHFDNARKVAPAASQYIVV